MKKAEYSYLLKSESVNNANDEKIECIVITPTDGIFPVF
jgi:hypothetical protein